MRKAYMTISALLLCTGMMLAQTPANRTAKTVAADVLAQMPAGQQETYNDLIGQLSQAGDDAVQVIVGMINAPGKGSNAQTDYALSGLSHFVMAKGQESARLVVAKAYVKALGSVSERETKAFIIRQLQIMGGDEAVDALADYLTDKELSGPASRALARIATPAAGEALMAGLKSRVAMGAKAKRDMINAIGEVKVAGAEELLLTFVGSQDIDLQKAVLYALSQVGGEASLKVLGDAAAQAGYTMEKSGANEAYIELIKNIAAKGNVAAAEKAAKDLQKKAEKANQLQTREAALKILLSLKGNKDATKMLLAALKDPCKGYRNAALNFASDYVGESDYIEVVKATLKAKPEVKVDVINWLGREAKCPAKNPVLKKLMVRFDLSLAQVLTQQLKSGDFAVEQAAVWTMVKLGDASFVPTIANLLTNSDKQVVLLAQDALLAFPGKIDNAVAEAINKAGDDGKVAGLELLAVRMADSKVNTVLEQMKSSSAAVKGAAYTALQKVVTARDFTTTCGLLESQTEANDVKLMQEAVKAAVHFMPAAEQVSTVTRRMYQAGEAKKSLYYAVLASTNDPKALQIIIDGCNKNTGAAKTAAVEALMSWKGIEAAEYLFEIAKGSGDLANRSLTRYVNLIASSSMTGENKLLRLRKAMDIAKSDDVRSLVLQKVEGTGTYLAMLYAAEYLDNKPVQQPAANAVMNIALGHPEYTGQNVRAMLEKVMKVLDNPDAHYQVEGIKKHLAEMPDEVGFVPMFNGKDLTGWKGMVEGGNPYKRYALKPAKLAKEQEKADERMRADWIVEDGCLVYLGTGYDNLCSEKQYGDFEMYVEWMLDPAGKEPDAGIYLRATPQVQIWDTSRVNVGAQVGSGGLYNNQVNESKPSKVADNKLGEWNTFYIKMVGDRVTVDFNGERVVDNVILENYWDRSKPIFATEQIELQAHGSKCYFRNIYVKELKRQEPFQLSEQEKKEGFQVLFDGTNMYEWQGNTGDYILEDGCISMVPSRSFGGNLYTKKEFANFIYRFEFQLTPGANNGVGLRAPLEGDAAYVGMESQILDCEHPIYKGITPYQHHGSIYGILKADESHKTAMKPVGEWNEEEIICDGDNIKVTLNGVVIVEGNIREAVKNGTPDKKEHPGLFNKKGHIGFLGHGSPVKFRNIRVKELK